MTRREGSIRKRGTGWEYRFQLDPDPLTGKRRRASKGGFATEREAKRALREAISAHEKGRYVRPSRRTVEDFLDEWHQAVRPAVRPSTWVSYRDYKDAYVIPVVGGTVLQELTPVRLNLLYKYLLEKGRGRGSTDAAMYEHWRKQGASGRESTAAELARIAGVVHSTASKARQRYRAGRVPAADPGLAPKTVLNVHRMLHRALRDAVRWGYLTRNVAEDAERPRARRKRPNVWTSEQLRTFVDHVRDDEFFALWLLLATTGVRRSELAGLRRGDVDLERGRVSPSEPRVVVDGYAEDSDTKTDSGHRSMALDPLTLGALRDYIVGWESGRAEVGHESDLLFCWPDGSPIHPQTITDWFKRHVRAAGLPEIRLHDVRHSYATAALKAGVHPKIVSERLGHASAAFTITVYSHVIDGMDEAAAGVVADLIFGDEKEPADSSADPLGHKSGHTTRSTPLPAKEVKGESPGQR